MTGDAAHAQVLAAERARAEAMTAGDVDALDALLDDECSYVHSTGAIDTKDEYLDRLRTGALVYRTVRISEQEVLELGDGCAVSHRMDAEMVLGGVVRPYQGHVISLYRRTSGVLRLIYLQATTIPGEAG